MSGDNVKVALPLFQEVRGGAVPTSPHQFEIIEIKAITACELNKRWHSRLPEIHWSNVVRNTHYVCYGAKFKGEWFAVGIWSSPVAQNRFKDGRQMLELRRLAIAPQAPKNTATRMIAIMVRLIKIKHPDINRLISYQDTEVHKGTIYKASNWEVGGESEGMSWSTKTRSRNKEQTMAKKIRWEFMLKTASPLKEHKDK
jgi:hypothetical protein